MRKKLLAFSFAAFISSFSFCQQNFIPGEIYRNGIDTIRGFINYRSWQTNPKSIQFKAGETDQPTAYTVDELEGFTVYNQDSYRKFITLVDGNAVEINAVTTYDTSLIKLDTIFLRELVAAQGITLYELNDFKKHFFIQIGNSEVTELLFRRSYNPLTTMMSSDNWFRTQLKNALGDSITKKQLRTIDNLSYETRDLVKFFRSLEGYQKENQVSSKVLKQPFSFFLAGGMVYQQLKIFSRNENLNSLKFDPNYNYIFSGGIDLFHNRSLNRLFMRLELSYYEFKTEGKGETLTSVLGYPQTNYYSISQTNFTPSVSVMYHFAQPGKLKIYGGIATDFNISNYKEDTYRYVNHFNNGQSEEKEYFDPEKFWIGINGRLGVLLNKKFEAGLTYQLAGSYVNMSTTSVNAHPLSLRIYYHLR